MQTHHPFVGVRRLVLVSLALLGPGVQGARAQCEDIAYVGVPDFDLKRTWDCGNGRLGLPGDGVGHAYPLAIINWMAYLSNHGVPELTTPDGPQDWQSQAFYDWVTAMITELGADMHTTPSGTPPDWPSGFHSYVADHAPYEGFSIQNFAMDADTYQFGLFQSAANLMRAGGFLTVGIRWCRYHPETDTFTPHGNHVVALTDVEGPCNAFPWVEESDPSIVSDASTCTQSAFGATRSQLQFRTSQFDLDSDGSTPPSILGRWQLVHYRGASRAFVWGLRCFALPMAAGRCDPTNPRCLRIMRPRWWDLDPRPPIEDITLPYNAPILQVALSPDFSRVLLTTASAPGGVPIPARLLRYNLGDGTFQILSSFTANPGPIAFDRFGELFVLTSSPTGAMVLKRYNISDGTVVETASRVVSVVPQAVIYDDVSDELVGVTAATDRLVRWPRTLSSETSFVLPAAASDLIGTASIALSPLDNRPWAMGSGLERAYELIPGPGGVLTLGRRATLPGALGVTALSMDPGGRLYAATPAQVLVFREGTGTTWDPVTGSPFHGAVLGGLLAMPRDRDNYTGAARLYKELGPEPALPSPCPADMTGDGAVNSQDFFSFLQAFFVFGPDGDYNHDGAVSSQDFFDFLTDFFAGCP